MIKTRLINLAFSLAIIAGLVVTFWFVLPSLSWLSSPPRIRSTPVILQQVQTLSQLVTVKWVMEKVVICDDPATLSFLPMGESRVLLVAHATVLAGIDMGE